LQENDGNENLTVRKRRNVSIISTQIEQRRKKKGKCEWLVRRSVLRKVVLKGKNAKNINNKWSKELIQCNIEFQFGLIYVFIIGLTAMYKNNHKDKII
jgi:hypothetical protein